MIIYNGKIPNDIELKIKDSVTFGNLISLLEPIHRNSTSTRQRVKCPKCGSEECFVFANQGKSPLVKCFSGTCGLRLDVFGLLAEAKNINYHDALLYLAEVNGLGHLFPKDDNGEKRESSEPTPPPPPSEPKEIPQPKYEYVPIERIEDCANDFMKTALARCFVEVYGFKAEVVEEAALAYGCGGVEMPKWRSAGPHAVFPYADEEGTIFDAKVLAYREDGHRVKYTDRTGKEVALMTTLKAVDKMSQDSIPDRPLFGAHLAFRREQYPYVCIIESEKSALLMSMIMPDVLWLAAGSMNWISPSNISKKLAPFKDCRIRMLADRNAVAYWDEVAEAARQAGYDCRNCRRLVEYLFPEKEEDGSQCKRDIGDYVEGAMTDPAIKSIGRSMQRSLIRDLARRVRRSFSFQADTEPSPYDEPFLNSIPQ